METKMMFYQSVVNLFVIPKPQRRTNFVLITGYQRQTTREERAGRLYFLRGRSSLARIQCFFIPIVEEPTKRISFQCRNDKNTSSDVTAQCLLNQMRARYVYLCYICDVPILCKATVEQDGNPGFCRNFNIFCSHPPRKTHHNLRTRETSNNPVTIYSYCNKQVIFVSEWKGLIL